MPSIPETNTKFCWICGRDAGLEHCITDEHGLAVHKSCHEKRMLQKAGSCRQWEVIARELSVEMNSERVLELSLELNRALEEQGIGGGRRGHIAENNPNSKKNKQSGDYETILDDAVALMRSDFASMQLLFPERGSGGELRLLAFRGFNPKAAQFWEWVRADSNSTSGIALRDKSRVIAPDIATCDFMAGSEDQRTYLQTGIRACQTTPLIGRGGNVVGMVSTHWRTPHQPSEKDFQLLDTLARQAADLIESSARPISIPIFGGSSSP